MVQLVYTLGTDGLKIELIWIDKPASRLTESTVFRLYPACAQEEIRYTKIGAEIDPMTVVKTETAIFPPCGICISAHTALQTIMRP